MHKIYRKKTEGQEKHLLLRRAPTERVWAGDGAAGKEMGMVKTLVKEPPRMHVKGSAVPGGASVGTTEMITPSRQLGGALEQRL